MNRRKALIGLGTVGISTAAGTYIFSNLKHTKTQPIYPPQSITIAWPKSDTDSLLSIAHAKGFFEHYSLNVTTVPNIQHSSQALQMLQQHTCDAAILSVYNWIPNLMSGLPAQLLCGMSGGNFRLLVARKQRIERLADLNGLKIGIRLHSNQERLFFSILLRRKGMNPDQNVQWVPLEQNELLPALLTNQVQAIIGVDPFIWEILSGANKQVFELTGSQAGSWSKRTNRVLGLQKDFIAQHPNIAEPLIRSLKDAAKWQNQNLKEASELLANQWGEMTAEQILMMLKNENQSNIPVNNKLWEQIAQYIDEFKLLGQLPNDLKSSRVARQFCLNVP